MIGVRTFTDEDLRVLAANPGAGELGEAAAYILYLRREIAGMVESSGVQAIRDERRGQIEREGWDAAHDDRHTRGELVAAAICYAASAIDLPIKARCIPADANCSCRSAGECMHFLGDPQWGDPWPFEDAADKRAQHAPLRKLQIAGALIAAEIDRRLRAEAFCLAGGRCPMGVSRS